VVINESLVGVIQEIQKYGHIEHLLGARHGVRGIINRQFLDLKRQPSQMLDLVGRTPAAALGATRDKPDQEYCEKILDVFRSEDVRYFFYIGGNDSAQSAKIINELTRDVRYELRVIHIPKTIDNDLLANDHTPGFGSAARFVASAFIGDNLDNRALRGVKINILMGRNAGFITAASVLARRQHDDGPHLVYVPERPFNLDEFVNDVAEVYNRYGRCLIAVSEGIADDQGRPWAETAALSHAEKRALDIDEFGNVALSPGAGALADFLSETVRQRCDGVQRVRADSFGYIQRSFPLARSEVDAWEARLVGQMAVSYSLDADRDGSVALIRLPGTTYAAGTQLVDLSAVAPDAAPFTRELDDEFINERGNNITNSFRNYCEPLVGELPGVGWFEQISQKPPWSA
jgi:6-phosphofructokinase 1